MGAANEGRIILPSQASSLAEARNFVDPYAVLAGFSEPDRE